MAQYKNVTIHYGVNRVLSVVVPSQQAADIMANLGYRTDIDLNAGNGRTYIPFHAIADVTVTDA